jgi:peroxiredoxin
MQIECPNGSAGLSGTYLKGVAEAPADVVAAMRQTVLTGHPAYTLDYDGFSAPMSPAIPNPTLLATPTATGETLAALTTRGPVVLVFLRHFGCPLCQEMVADVAARRAAMADSGTTVVFVHMHPEAQAAAFFARYGVSDLQRISDPARTLYRGFGVPRARPMSWISLGSLRHYLSAIWRGHLPGLVGGDVGQMSAVVRIIDGRIDRDVRDAGFADRPDFDDLLTCPIA